MLFEAAAWRPDRPRPDVEETLAASAVARYIDDWPRDGDAGVVAAAVGAAWYRRFTADAPGYGFVAAHIPEVTIGVVAGARGRGIGGALLRALADAARADDLEALSLSVEEDNPALRLYERAGFERVALVTNAWTMRLTL
jgi:ribosomal protein S18 acetylase RimI-like enzyme